MNQRKMGGMLSRTLLDQLMIDPTRSEEIFKPGLAEAGITVFAAEEI